ncbi:MAG: flagellar hook basal-body protein [Polyangiaceae bacterium]
MSKGIYTALSGAIASSTALDVTAENLANASTAGFRKLRPVFREVLERETTPRLSPKHGHFTKIGSTAIDATPGALRTTGRPLDVALPSGVFIAVSAAGGERYTRAGSLSVSADGALTLAGSPVVGEGGEAIRAGGEGAGAGEVTVTADGEVLRGADSIGRLKLVTFDNPAGLAPNGGTLYAATPESGEATITSSEIAVGALEESNASPIDAMSELVKATRSFEAYERAIDAFRDADRRIVTLPGA